MEDGLRGVSFLQAEEAPEVEKCGANEVTGISVAIFVGPLNGFHALIEVNCLKFLFSP